MEDRVINNINELVKEMGCNDIECLERCLFKCSDCGLSFGYSDKGVCITGYVESDYDYCGESRSLLFPFTMSEFNKACNEMDECGCRIWDVINREGEYKDIDEDIMWELVVDIANEYEHDSKWVGSPIYR